MADLLFLPLAELIAGHQADVAVAVLSLADCQERRAALLQRGLPPSWVEHHWPGADLRHQPEKRVSAFLDVELALQRYRRPWRRSEVGCALSHRSALIAFLATPARLLLVLEDDVIPTTVPLLPPLSHIVISLLQVRPQALLCHLGPRPEHLDPVDLRPIRLPQPGLTPPLWMHQNRNRPLWRAHAYLISREAAERCLALEPDGLHLLADDWQARRQAGALGRLLVAAPALFVQDDVAPSTQHEPIPCALFTTQSALAPRRLHDAVQHRWQAITDRLLRRLPHLLR
jgi:glycosyl transferase family 25